ncbi:MAG TPA: hypothetical protein VGT99_12005 [Gammaproteobacteria bacterium]|nr:hypothetical protein [Gammaproteobacteria bacterium]
MRWTLIRYRTHPEKTEENAALVRAVFEELKAKAPPGLRYMAMRLSGGEFVHLVSAQGEPNPLLAMPAFQAFQAGVSERQAERAVRNEAEILGDYRVLGS